jgi:DNA-binding NtrC family response regulator
MSQSQATTVMIVDDEEMVVGSIQSFLELDTEHRVLPFTSPLAALERLGTEPVNVIVADFMMPEMDGVSFLTHARERRPEASRILLTGYADKQNAIRAINEAGLYQYLEKPWDNDALELVIRNAVERSVLFAELDARVSELERANAELSGFRERLIQAFR